MSPCLRLARAAAWLGWIFAACAAHAMDIKSLWNFVDPAASEAVFRERLRSATGDDALSLQTQIARSYSLRSRFNEAHALLDTLEPRLATAGPEPRVRALLERGRTLRSAKKVEQARPLFLQAVDIAGAARLDELTIDAMHMVALVEPGADAQLQWNRRALALAQASSEPNARNWDASLANNIGWTLHDQGQYEQALASFQAALAARERIGSAADIRSARWMVARALRSLRRHDEALALLCGLEREGAAIDSPDGFVFEEIGENLLAQGRAAQARAPFARAYELLSQDRSLERPDDEHLARLLRLSR
jgi:tetratricopeptide (TPR) repeat protein